jgi:hypothetical protein
MRWIWTLLLVSCGTIPLPHHERHLLPDAMKAYFRSPERPFEVLGVVRSKVNFSTLDEKLRSPERLCRNYFNRSVKELLQFASDQKADAVIAVESVVFLFDGSVRTYAQPECSNDGIEGQVLTQGKAIRWLD